MGWGPHKTRILDLGSHVQSPGWPPSPDPAPGVTRPQSPGWPPSPDPAPGVTCPVSRVTPVPRPCTWGHTSTVSRVTPPDTAPAVTRPQSPGWCTPPPQTLHRVWHNPWLGHQVSAGWAPKAETSGFLWFPGMVERSVGLVPSPQTCRRDVLLLSVVLTDINYFYSCTIALNTLPWFWQARSFLVPLRCWETHWALEDEGQVWSLLSMGCLLEGDHSSNLTCCPLAFCLIHVPCNPFTKWICLPSRYAHASELE